MAKNKMFDLGDSKIFSAVAWGCAAIGAAAGVHFAAAATTLGAVAAGVGGAVAGAVLLPTAVAFTGVTAFIAIKSAIQFLKNEGPFIPLASIMVGYASLRALVEPFGYIAKKIGGIFSKDKTSAPAASDAENAKAPETVNPPAVESKKGMKACFAAVMPKRKRVIREEMDHDDIPLSPGLTD